MHHGPIIACYAPSSRSHANLLAIGDHIVPPNSLLQELISHKDNKKHTISHAIGSELRSKSERTCLGGGGSKYNALVNCFTNYLHIAGVVFQNSFTLK